MARDLASRLLKKSLGAMAGERSCCSRCRRSPLTGELMHVFERDETLCTLCLAKLPDTEREPLRSERVHAAERKLTVMPRAA
jgi:hypothetical protein